MIVPHERIHIIGVGGAGMSALAKILIGHGHTVSGSDLKGGVGLEALADRGVAVSTGHNPDVAVRADLVVASSAVPEYDEELVAARDAGVTTWRRPELLEAITSDTATIGATGTHGKTTTTALLISALRAMGLDPSFVLGGDLVEMGTNGHVGDYPLLVLEADEAFRTFESLHLDGLVITNVEPEHLSHFGSERALIDSFASVARSVDGPVLACADDAGASQVAERSKAVTYGRSENADWKVANLRTTRAGSVFDLEGPSSGVVVRVGLPGKHVALNAAGALALLAEQGHDLESALAGIEGYRGVGRRWEHRGTVDGVELYDDYAHHPTEVAVMVEMATEVAVGRLWAVFQPHLYSRTKQFSDEFGEALAGADFAVVTDVFGAREEPVPGITGELVADAARSHGAEVHYVPHRSELAEFLVGRVETGDLVLSMGAGDITLLHTELASRLGERS